MVEMTAAYAKIEKLPRARDSREEATAELSPADPGSVAPFAKRLMKHKIQCFPNRPHC